MRISIALSKSRCFSLAIIVLGLLMQDFAEAQTTEIKVLYVYTTSVKNKPQYADIKEDLLDNMKAQVEGVFFLSGFPSIDLITVGHREITLSGPNPVNEDNLDLIQLQELSRNQDPAKKLTTSDGWSIAELRAGLEADIVIMIYDEDKTAVPGGIAAIAADGNLPTHPFPWPEIHLISITDVVAFSNELILPHEIGHVLGCRHPNGTGPGTDNGTVPFPNCHGYVFADGQFGTVMTSTTCVPPACTVISFFSDQDADFVTGGVNFGKRGDANADAVASLATAAATVSTYGDNLMPPAPPSVMGYAEPLGCNGNFGQFLNTWWALSTSTPVDSFEVQRKSGLYWDPYFSGGASCVAYISSDNTDFRVRGISAISGTGPWDYYPAYHNCYGGGGGPPK